MSYITKFLPDKPDSNTLTEETFKAMSLVDIVEYFNNYEKLKVFCRSLAKEPSSAKIILIKNEDEITEENTEEIKNTLLSFMKLPETTKAKNKELKAKYADFRGKKYKQIMISLVIIKKKLQENEQQTT